MRTPQDGHSFANPDEVVVRHLDLDWDVRFDRRTLDGSATLHVERVVEGAGAALRLDGADWTQTPFTLGEADPILGAPLEVTLSEAATQVRIAYTTSPGASGVQWLEPVQTAGKMHPFMFTQSQANPCARLDSAAGHTRCAGHLPRNRAHAARTTGGDERRQRRRDAARRRVPVRDAPADSVISDCARRRRSRVSVDGGAHGGVCRAVGGRVGRRRVQRHRGDDGGHRTAVRTVSLGALRPAGAAAQLSVRWHGEPAADVRHADRHRRGQEPGRARGTRARALVVGQSRDQRHLA